MLFSPDTYPIERNLDLFRGGLSAKEVDIPFSAAGLQASRLAACFDGSFVFATGPHVYRLTCSPTRKRTRPRAELDGTFSTQPGEDDEREDKDSTVSSIVSSAIADEYLIPRPFAEISVDRYMIHSTHQSEVQSISADDTRVASVDAYGRCIITLEHDQEFEGDVQISARERETKCYVLASVSISDGDHGWSGVALRRNDSATAAVTRQMYRDVTLFDVDTPVRTIHTILAPEDATYCGEGQMIAVAERKDLSFFDGRVGERKGCIARKAVAKGRLLCLDASDDGLTVGTGGMDRVLHVFDIRTMTVRDRWRSCLKYECAGAVLSRSTDGMVYVCSVDNEVACGAWSAKMASAVTRIDKSKSLMISGANTKSPRRTFGFRGDVRLTGIARRSADGEEIGVISESGAFYLLRGMA